MSLLADGPIQTMQVRLTYEIYPGRLCVYDDVGSLAERQKFGQIRKKFRDWGFMLPHTGRWDWEVFEVLRQSGYYRTDPIVHFTFATIEPLSLLEYDGRFR